MEPARSGRISELEGQRLGPYELVEMVGRGGMAVVYKAMQPTLRRYVAIKVLPGYFVHDEGFRLRFQQEAETVAHLEHPNILPIYDFGQEGDVPYIVMPLVTGGTLRDWLAQPMPLDRALTVLGRVLAALEYAHSQRVVHRDIKPSNILMSQGDWPLLTDFGIAKIVEGTLRVTRSGTMLGTPEYMAPEQSQGAAVDHRADLYAMGIILYELLTGRLPFEGQTPVAVILQHVRDAVPSPRALNPRLSAVWDEIIERSLAKNPDERYSSATVMDEAIQAAWQRVRRESDQFQTVGRLSTPELYDSAQRALVDGNWQRVISLVGQILDAEPAHPEAVNLLTQAHEALRRQQAEEREQAAANFLREGDAALAEERFGDAVRAFGEALRIDATLKAASDGLERVQQAQARAELYRAARDDIAAERWNDAASRLERLVQSDPDYRDVTALRQYVAEQRQLAAQLAGWYDQGSAAAARQDWPAAIAAFHALITAAPTYRDAAARLAEVYEHVERERASSPVTQPGQRGPSPASQPAAGPRPAEPTIASSRGSPAATEDHRITQPRAPAVAAAAAADGPAAATSPWAGAAPASPAPAVPAPLAPPAARGGTGKVQRIAVLGIVGLLALVVLGVGARQLSGVLAPATPTAVATSAPRPTSAAGAATPVPTAADFFPACDSAAQDERWTEALAACERVREMDAALPGLDAALAKTYLALGKRSLDESADVGAALEYFGKAVAARPDDAEAEQQRLWALAYQEGDAALTAENWPLATEKLAALYTVAPAYLERASNGGLKSRLARARLGWGQALLRDGSYADALRRCEEALELLPDSADAAACRTSAQVALATPTPLPAPTAVPQPQQPQQPRPAPTSPPQQPQQPRPAPTAVPQQQAPQQQQPQQPRPAPTAVPQQQGPPTRPPQQPVAPPTRPPS